MKHIWKDEEEQDFNWFMKYPGGGKPPMMNHVFEDSPVKRIIAAKGAPESRLINVSNCLKAQKKKHRRTPNRVDKWCYRGYWALEKPILKALITQKEQQGFSFTFKGILAFYDPPKEKNIAKVLEDLYSWLIAVKINLQE